MWTWSVGDWIASLMKWVLFVLQGSLNTVLSVHVEDYFCLGQGHRFTLVPLPEHQRGFCFMTLSWTGAKNGLKHCNTQRTNKTSLCIYNNSVQDRPEASVASCLCALTLVSWSFSPCWHILCSLCTCHNTTSWNGFCDYALQQAKDKVQFCIAQLLFWLKQKIKGRLIRLYGSAVTTEAY